MVNNEEFKSVESEQPVKDNIANINNAQFNESECMNESCENFCACNSKKDYGNILNFAYYSNINQTIYL